MSLAGTSRGVLAALAVMLLAGLMGAAPAWASPGTGWVRLAPLSPDTPPMDVYLYSFGDSHARLVRRDVSYGIVSPYQQVRPGGYTVSMRPAGVPPSEQPVLSTSFWVRNGRAYTVAVLGLVSGLRLRVLTDPRRAPAGRALVRVVLASLRRSVVRAVLGGTVLARRLRFASVIPYRAVTAGSPVMRITGPGADASLRLPLPPDSVHTLVVLDGTSGLRIIDLDDAAGRQVLPRARAAAGRGGTASRPASSLPGLGRPWLGLPWLGLIAAASVLAGLGPRRGWPARLPGSRTP
jgi:hypothetical protein